MNTTSSQRDDGKKRKVLPKDLVIVWGKDPRYWHLQDSQSEESCYAELLQVYWLEVSAKFEGLVPNKKYCVGFTVSFNQDMFGWNTPIYLTVKVGNKGRYNWKKIPIDSSKRGSSSFNIPESGNLTVEVKTDESEVYVGLYEVWSGKWKGGLKIYSAFAQEVS